MAAKPDTDGVNGAVAIVTGAGSGLGQATAEALAARGARVVVTELPDRMRNAAATVAAIEALGGAATAVPLDVRDLASIATCARAAVDYGGRIDVLVNNAGLNIPQLAFDVTEEAWDNIL